MTIWWIPDREKGLFAKNSDPERGHFPQSMPIGRLLRPEIHSRILWDL